MTVWGRFGKIAIGMIAVGIVVLFVEMRVGPSNPVVEIDTSRILKDSEILISLGDVPTKFVSKMVSDAMCTDSCKEKRDRFESAISQERYVTHVSTDKQTFRPGDTVYVRGVIVDIRGDRPISSKVYLSSKLEIKGPSGSSVYESWLENQQDSVVAGWWKIPSDIAGGEYRVEISPNRDGCPKGWRTFNIRTYRQPKLSITIDFEADKDNLAGGYGFGDVVRGRVKALRSDGARCASAQLFWNAAVDGVAMASLSAPPRLNADGEAAFEFRLPADTGGDGQGSVSVTVSDGGDVEGQAKTVPMVLRSIDLRLYPEGGDLVAGLQGRVYFEARTRGDEPIALDAVLWELAARPADAADGNAMERPLCAVVAAHEGRGRFEFTPLPGAAYEIRTTKPAGLAPVPVPSPSFGPGVTLHTGPGYFGPGEPIRATVTALGADRRLRVAVYRRESELSSTAVSPAHGEPTAVVLSLPRDAAGVLRVTVYEATADGGEAPLAERLIFRAPPRALAVAVRPSASTLAPGGPAVLHLAVTDAATGQPAAGAVLGVAVTDARNHLLTEARRRRPLLPAMALLEGDVLALDDAGAYLPDPAEVDVGAGGPDGPGGADGRRCGWRLDLLLGTQGWRRFLYLDPLRALPPPGATGGGGERERERVERVLGVHEMEVMLAGGAGPFMAMDMAMPRMAMAEAMPQLEKAMAPMAMMAFAGPAEGEREVASRAEEALVDESAGPPMMPGGPMMNKAHMAAPMAAMDAPMAALPLPILPPPMAPVPPQVPEWQPPVAAGESDAAAGAAAGGAADDWARGPEPAADAGLAVAAAAPVAWEPAVPQMLKMRMPAAAPLLAADVMPGMAGPMAWGWGGRPAPATQRVYARAARAAGAAEARGGADEEETVFWAAGVVADARGEVNVSFAVGSAAAAYRVVVEAHARGDPAAVGPAAAAPAYGASDSVPLVARLELQVDVKLPAAAVVGDRIDAPITVVNGAAGPLRLARVHIAPSGALAWAGDDAAAAVAAAAAAWPAGEAVAAGGYVRRAVRLEVVGNASRAGGGAVAVRAAAEHSGGGEEAGDWVTRRVAAEARGFPMTEARGGILRPPPPAPGAAGNADSEKGGGGGGEWEWTVPEGAEGPQVSIRVMPSPVASLTAALEALLQEPCGCFEQASATTYPTVMALQYFRSRPDCPAEVIAKAEGLLAKGYERLAGYEVKESGGFEWFGASPAHEALTAYGLLLFIDMRKVWSPQGGMEGLLDRTRAFLRARRDDPAASFLLSPQHLDEFGGAPGNVARAYILWSLSEAPGEADGLDAQMASLHAEAAKSEDAYVLGLAAATLINIGHTSDGLEHARRLAHFQEADGSVSRAPTTITSSRGEARVVETTSIAVIAWLKAGDELQGAAMAAVEWLAGRSRDGRFGSTQATVLGLKAIMAYEAALGQGAGPDLVSLDVDGVTVATQAPPPGFGAAVTFEDVPEALAPGPHRLRLHLSGGTARLPYAATLRYRSSMPAACGACRVRLEVRLVGGPAVAEGAVAEVLVAVEPAPPPVGEDGAVSADGAGVVGMTVAVVGLPGGLEPRFDRLAELRREGQVDWFELRGGNEVVLYWRFLKARKAVRLEAIGGVPGEYTGRASRAYEYYHDECKAWAPVPLAATVLAREDAH